MTLILVKNKKAADLPSLTRLAIRYVYDKKRMRAVEVALMRDSIISWSQKVDISEEEQILLEKIATFLKKDELGQFDRRKELFKKKGINWGKFHKVPEIYRD